MKDNIARTSMVIYLQTPRPPCSAGLVTNSMASLIFPPFFWNQARNASDFSASAIFYKVCEDGDSASLMQERRRVWSMTIFRSGELPTFFWFESLLCVRIRKTPSSINTCSRYPN
jgi:hypothetical protein